MKILYKRWLQLKGDAHPRPYCVVELDDGSVKYIPSRDLLSKLTKAVEVVKPEKPARQEKPAPRPEPKAPVQPKVRRFAKKAAKDSRAPQEWRDNPNLIVEHLMTLPGAEDPYLWPDRINSAKGYAPGNLRWSEARDIACSRFFRTQST